MTRDKIVEELFKLQDLNYKKFHKSIVPNVDESRIIGVRTPALRKFAKQILSKESISETETFLRNIPHFYFEENQLHAFLISLEKDFSECAKKVCEFLPCIDNWATCDQLSPKAFKKNHALLLPLIDSWISSQHAYTVRFAIGMLMQHFLDNDFDEKFFNQVLKIRTDEYYVNMMRAWYFATALAKQYDSAIKILESKSLDEWTHRKTIQKASESFRISDERKEYIKSLR